MEPDGGRGELVHVSEEDAALVRASTAAPELFEQVFDRYHRAIWSYVARVAGRDRADDVAGDVFVAAFASRAGYDPARGSVRAWLYGIATNLLKTRFRSDARAARAFERVARELRAPIPPTDLVDDALSYRARLERVVAALAGLSGADREIIVLFAWERLSYEEIAAVVGVEVGTVRSRLSRARARLRELVEPSGEVVVTPQKEPADG